MCDKILQEFLFSTTESMKEILYWLLYKDISDVYRGVTKIGFSNFLIDYIRQQFLIFQDACKVNNILNLTVNFSQTDANCHYCKFGTTSMLSNPVFGTEYIPSNYKPLTRLANLFSSIMETNLLNNLISEISFLLSLLQSDPKIDLKEFFTEQNGVEIFSFENLKLFKTGIDCIYFASLILMDHGCLVLCLDSSTLKNLAHYQNLQIFATPLCLKIHDFIRKKLNRQIEPEEECESKFDTVKFHRMNDSEINFPTSHSFVSFKNLRDDFYVLFNDWKKFRFDSQKFFATNYKRVRHIISGCYKSENMFRFAELFISQLIASDRIAASEKNENSSSNRLDLLNRRLFTPTTSTKNLESSTLTSSSVFTDTQEFFKDFIRCTAESSFFLTFLREILIHRISVYNARKFSDESTTKNRQLQLFLTNKNKLCLMAKFLSLITFMPYKTDYLPQVQIRSEQIEIRSESLPPLDLEFFIYEAAKNGRLIITVPWIIEFLFGIDKISIWLPFYKRVLKLLQFIVFKIHLPRCKEILSTSSLPPPDYYSRIFVSLYIHCIMKEKFLNIPALSALEDPDLSIHLPINVIIDCDFLIDDIVLHKCFPHFEQMRFPTPKSDDLFLKRMVVPISTDPVRSEKRFLKKSHIQLQIESQFLAGLPFAVRNTIDFVAKRISATCIASISDQTIPVVRNRIKSHIKTKILKKGDKNRPVLVTKIFHSDDNTLAIMNNFMKIHVDEKISKFSENCKISIETLLVTKDPDVPTDVCAVICKRKFKQLVGEWMECHINFDEMVIAEIDNIMMDKKSESEDDDGVWDFDFDNEDGENFVSDGDDKKLLEKDWKNLVNRIISDDNKHDLTIDYFIKIIDSTILYCDKKSEDDVTSLLEISVEALNSLVYCKPSLVTEKLVKYFCCFWQRKFNLKLIGRLIEEIFDLSYMDYFILLKFCEQTAVSVAMSIYFRVLAYSKIYSLKRVKKSLKKYLESEYVDRAVVYSFGMCFMLVKKSAANEMFKSDVSNILEELLTYVHHNY